MDDLRPLISAVAGANLLLQKHVDARGKDVPLALLKALSDVDWAVKQMVYVAALFGEGEG